MSDPVAAIAARLAVLEAKDAIRDLKHRYFRACDHQRADLVAACFAPGAVVIDYQEFPRFDSGQAFADIFKAMGCQPQVVDIHHGQNPVIEIEDENNATGQWDLYYFNLNLDSRAAFQLGGTYQDRYVRLGGQWLMVETVFRRSSVMTWSIGPDGALTVTGGGRATPTELAAWGK